MYPTLTAQPMHWIYNPERLKEVLSDLEPCPEFRPQSANPFYRRETGEQTCYGDQAYVLLESLSQCGGSVLTPNRTNIQWPKVLLNKEHFMSSLFYRVHSMNDIIYSYALCFYW